MPPIKPRKPPMQFDAHKARGKIIPAGKLGAATAKGKVPKGARVYLLERKGQGTTPLYVYSRSYNLRGRGPERYFVLDLRNTHFSAKKPEQVEAMHEIVIGLGLGPATRSGRVVIKTFEGWQIEKTLYEHIIAPTKRK